MCFDNRTGRSNYVTRYFHPGQSDNNISGDIIKPCGVGSVGSVSASRTVGCEFASRPGHTKDHHKNGTNCLPA